MALLIILVWLICGHGVIGCGRGVFDSPTVFSDILLLVGVPISLFVASVKVFLKCSTRLDEDEVRTKS